VLQRLTRTRDDSYMQCVNDARRLRSGVRTRLSAREGSRVRPMDFRSCPVSSLLRHNYAYKPTMLCMEDKRYAIAPMLSAIRTTPSLLAKLQLMLKK